MGAPRILVVDDDRSHLLHLEKLLRREGYEVVKATDGLAAFAILETDLNFDAVLLDRNMPGLSGMELLHRIKLINLLSDIPVILQTELGDPKEVQEGLRAGARFYLTKPLDRRMLLGVVGAAVEEFEKRKQFWLEIESASTALGLMRRGRFSLNTLAQCQDLASALARACPDPKRVVVGLSELLINALEHGNLGISYALKSQLIEAKAWRQEVERLQALPENTKKRITVEFIRLARRIRFRISDMGSGFAWKEFMQPSPERLFDTHGRGILLAKWEAFDRIDYREPGNCVTVEVLLRDTQGN